jgi:hypothetical protein
MGRQKSSREGKAMNDNKPVRLVPQSQVESNSQEIKELWGALIEMRDLKPDFWNRRLGKYMEAAAKLQDNFLSRLETLEKKAAFVKGFERETKGRLSKPWPAEGAVWIDSKGGRWTIGPRIGTEYVGRFYQHLTNFEGVCPQIGQTHIS